MRLVLGRHARQSMPVGSHALNACPHPIAHQDPRFGQSGVLQTDRQTDRQTDKLSQLINLMKLAYVYFFKISRGLGVGGDNRPSQNEGLREFKSPQIRSLCLKFGLYDTVNWFTN